MANDQNSLIDRFWRQNKHKYTHLDINVYDVRNICKAPFLQMKNELAKGTMKDCRLPYLGVFAVRSWGMVKMLKSKKRQLDLGYIGAPEYKAYKELLEKRLLLAWPEFERFSEHLKPYINVRKFRKNGTVRYRKPKSSSKR